MSGSEPKTSVHSSKGEVGGDEDGPSLVALAYDFEEEFGAGLGEEGEAQFVDDEEFKTGQLLLVGVEQSPLVSGLLNGCAKMFPTHASARGSRLDRAGRPADA